jgi:hypothetical protein
MVFFINYLMCPLLCGAILLWGINLKDDTNA